MIEKGIKHSHENPNEDGSQTSIGNQNMVSQGPWVQMSRFEKYTPFNAHYIAGHDKLWLQIRYNWNFGKWNRKD